MRHDHDASAALLEQVNQALNERTPVRIQGSNSKAMLGRPVSGDVLDTRSHRGIVSYDPTELVLSARAGTPLLDIEAALDAAGQMLPFEPPHLGREATHAAVRAELRARLFDWFTRLKRRTTVTDAAIEKGTNAHKKAGVFFGQW